MSFVKSCIRKYFYSRRFVHEVVATVDKRKVYSSLPYFGAQFDKLKTGVGNLVKQIFLSFGYQNCATK